MRKRMKDSRRLIGKILAQSASEEERGIFNKWLSESISNREEYDRLSRIWDAKRIEHQYDLERARSTIALRIRLSRNVTRTIYVYWQKIAAVLLIPLVTISVYLLLQLNDAESVEYQVALQTVECSVGNRSRITLPDGTLVWLNSGSSITFPVSFADSETRDVALSGEAYFDVTKDPRHPFMLNLGEVCLEVVGTSFNVSNYAEDKKVEVMLESGEVKLFAKTASGPRETRTMVPGQLATINRDTEQITIDETLAEKHISWTRGHLVFNDDKMSDVVRKLERWYNVDIKVRDEEINQYQFTATLVNLSIEQVLNLLQFTSPIVYQVDNMDVNGEILDQKKITISKRN
jgi:transmembrane sensor